MLRKELRRHERRETFRRRLLAGSTAVILALGMAAGGAAPAFATPPGGGSTTNTNSAAHWQQLPGEVCVKPSFSTEDSTTTPFSLPALGAGLAYSKVIVKAGSTGKSVQQENAVFTRDSSGGTLTQGDTFVHPEKDSISHVIYCYVPSVPSASTDVDCTTIEFLVGRALNGSDHINVDIVYNGQRGQINVEINEVQAANGDPVSDSGLYALYKFDAIGLPNVKVAISAVDAAQGRIVFGYSTYLTGQWTIEWIQFNSTYFNKDRATANFVVCGDLPTENLVTPTARMVDLKCDTDGSYTLDDVEGVRWFIGDDEVQPGTYTVSAATTVVVRAEADAPDYGLEPGASDEWTFVFTEPKDCPTLECIPDEFISYTYINSGPSANTGVVTVAQPQGRYSDELCRPLYVTAAAWAFDVVDKVWTQTLVVANRINDGNAITKVGVYPYGAPVGCGQGDIYASRTAFPNPSPLLLGPNKPAWPEGVTPWAFSEVFLHDMKFSGPNPTYVVTPPGCNAVEPVMPTVSAIEKCDTDGSLSLTTSPFISYLVRDAEGDLITTVAFDATQGTEQITVPGATAGSFTITPVAVFPYILKNYDASDPRWSPDLGERYDCPIEVEPVAQKSTCETGGASILLPPVDGVVWFVNGVKTPASTTAIPVLAAGAYTVTVELDPDAEGGPFVFAPDAETEWPFVFTDAEICDLPELPITNASIGFIDPTCDEGQKLDPAKLLVDDETLAKLERYEEFDDGTYEVVFVTTDEDARFFDSSTPVAGRTVSEGGTVLTFTGTLAGPLTGDDCVRSIVVVDPYGVDDRCLTKPSYWVELIEGITYTITVDDEAPVVVEWAGTDERRTFAAERGSTLKIEAAPASELFTLTPPTGPLNHTFAVYPEDCLPTLPLTEGSVTFTPATCLEATNWVVLPNVDGVQWWVDSEQTAAGKWPMAAGDVVVEATPLPGYGFSAEAETRWEYTFPTADEACDLSSLAETGASNALVGVGLAAVLITLAGFGVVIGRRFQQV